MEIGRSDGRTAGRAALLLLLTACGMASPPPAQRDELYDLLLKGGSIIDGSGNPQFAGDVAIKGDRIVATGYWEGIQARDTIDVTGLVVAPGFIETEMTEKIPKDQVLPLIPLNRIGKADDVASVVNFLCTEENMYIHGQVIGINGGLAM